MSFKVYDWKCECCGKVLKDCYTSGDKAVRCVDCQLDMNRLVSAPGMVKGNFADGPRVR